ncbi:MAG: carboxymuconolactone decarboxylase family protein, partial [Alphaproteobacteria bacterium]|nr:carboxymuconolactone decarboxylase family protein [Alphaproteobacteria bacterium]
GLPRKMRSCAVLGMVIAQRQVSEIGYHTKMALANGLTKAEIEEILTTAIPYCGLPTASTARAAMLQAFAEVEGKG